MEEGGVKGSKKSADVLYGRSLALWSVRRKKSVTNAKWD